MRRKRPEATYEGVTGAAVILGISVHALYERLRTETLPEEVIRWKVLGQWRFDRASLLAYVNGPESSAEVGTGTVWRKESDGSVTTEETA